MARQEKTPHNLPACVIEYIRLVVKRMRYSRSARADVRQEFIDHFSDALADCPTAEERQKRAEQLIAEFGDAKLLGALIRRGKKRCRPFWKKSLIRAGQGFLLLLVLLGLYASWFATGKPTLSVNYLAMLNRMNQPAPDEQDNAWPDYDRAIQAYQEPPKFVDAPPASDDPASTSPETIPGESVVDINRSLAGMPAYQQKTVRDWLDKNDAAWQHYVAGTHKPYCWTPYTVPKDSRIGAGMMAMTLPPLGKLRTVGKSGIWRARFALQEGRVEEAIDDCLAVARAGRQWQKPTDTLIPQMVGLATSTLAQGEILKIVEHPSLSADVLKRTQEQLEALYPKTYPLIDPSSEKFFFQDTVQWTFTQGGPGGGHIIPQNLWAIINSGSGAPGGGQEPQPSLLLTMTLAVAGTTQAGRTETLEKGNAIYDAMIAMAKRTPYEQRGNMQSVEAMVRQLPQWRYEVLYMIIPSLERAGILGFQGKGHLRGDPDGPGAAALSNPAWRVSQYPQRPADQRVSQAAAYGPIQLRPPWFTARRAMPSPSTALAEDYTDDGGAAIPDDGWEPIGRKGRVAGGDHVFWPVADEDAGDQRAS